MANIGVIGSGKIGGGLARKWAARGHAISFGTRDPAKPEVVELAVRIGARATEIEEAVAQSEVVLFAIPGGAMELTAARLGTLLDGRAVIDAANNVRGVEMHSFAAIKAAAAGAAYYRAFNSYGWELIEKPVVGGTPADLFYCGPDGTSRTTVEQLIADVGLRPVWVGGPDQVDVVDGLLRLWFTLVRQRGHSRRTALKLLED